MTRPVLSKPKPVKGKRKMSVEFKPVKVDRKKVEAQLKALCIAFISWRDGQECVMKGRGKCGGGMMWNHLIGQKRSPWLRYNLGNIFWGCGSHNMDDYYGSTVFSAWFVSNFGSTVFLALDAEREKHSGQRPSIIELQEMLAHYENLYQNRYTAPVGDLQAMIAAGYYGEVVKDAVFKDGVVYKHEGHLVTRKEQI